MDCNKDNTSGNLNSQQKLSHSSRRHLRRKKAKIRRTTSTSESSEINAQSMNTKPREQSEQCKNKVLAGIKKICELQECLTECHDTKNLEVANLLSQSHPSDLIPICDHIPVPKVSSPVLVSKNEVLTVDKTSTNNQVIVTDISKMEDVKTAPSVESREAILAQRKEKKAAKKNPPEKIKQIDPENKSTETDASRESILAARQAKKNAKKNKDKSENIVKEMKHVTIEDKVVEKSKNIQMNTNKQEAITIEQENKVPVVDKANLNETEQKSKSQLKAERRAKQEAQRAAKTSSTVVPKTTTTKTKPSQETPVKKIEICIKEKPKASIEPKVQLFSHLYVTKENVDYSAVNPKVFQLGLQYKAGIVQGSNARCIAMLEVIKDMISNYKTPPRQEFGRGFEVVLKKNVDYLHSCRPISVSMMNALKFLKWQLTQLSNNITDADATYKLHDCINVFIKEQIEMAGQAISNTVQPKIDKDDVILTYGCSSLIQNILLEAHRKNQKFHVVVIDGRPSLEGRELLRRLVSAGVKCSYGLISSVSFIMPIVSKVLLGAHALLANGHVMSRTGTAQVALSAKANNVPVLVCCETYKFCERVQTDSFVYNELGDPDLLITPDKNILSDWRKNASVVPLNIAYDVTPPDLVTAVVTELAILPCTSVPVILRVKPTDSC